MLMSYSRASDLHSDVAEESINARIRRAVGQQSARRIALITGFNHETVRRYLKATSPSPEFLCALIDKFGISGHWLVCGQGPMMLVDALPWALESALPSELCEALARHLDRLEERIDVLEQRTRARRGSDMSKAHSSDM